MQRWVLRLRPQSERFLLVAPDVGRFLGGQRRSSTLTGPRHAATNESVDGVADELVDRFGPLPEPVRNLIAVARFRVVCRAHGITEVALQGNTIRFSPMTLAESAQLRLARLYERTLYKPGVAVVSVGRPSTGIDPISSSELDGRPTRPVKSPNPEYVAKKGDTYRSIARDLLGSNTRADEIRRLNLDAVEDPDRPAAGQRLRLPLDARAPSIDTRLR